MQRNLPLLGLSAVGLGLVGLAFQDFALQWQPVPADVPMRTALAVVSAIVLAVAGGLASVPATRRIGAFALAAVFAIWTLGLKLPPVVATPGEVVIWLGLAEIGAMAAGGLALVAVGTASDDRRRTLILSSRILLGGCALVFGISHFVYAKFTAAMVPGWMPAPLFWAYFTGACHTAAGLALISGVAARRAAALLALMCAGFALLLHLPRVVAAPSAHVEWVMLFIALCIAGGAWAVRDALPASATVASR